MLMNILIVCMLIKYSNEQLMKPFYGDINLQVYLLDIKTSKRSTLIVVNDLQIDNQTTISKSSSNSLMSKYLHTEGIPHRLFSSLTISQLKSQLPTFAFSSMPNVIILFDASTINFNQQQMNLLLDSLQQIYFFCRKCLPVIAIVDLPLDVISQMVGNFKLLRKSFRAVIVSKKSNSSVVHVNPVLYGCQQELRVFTPRKNTDDFAKLKACFQECNLHNTTLNVSISHVSNALAVEILSLCI